MTNNLSTHTWQNLCSVREYKPLVHNITNLVVTEFAANTLLACGASPLMAHDPNELSEIVNISKVLNINIGTLDSEQINNMGLAIQEANQQKKLIIIDPVGAGASLLRTNTALKLIKMSERCIIKGNGSEILALSQNLISKSKGVDSVNSPEQALSAAKLLIKQFNIECIVITGASDLVISSDSVSEHNNGDQLMTKVTGTGCSLGGIIAAFCAVENDAFKACQSAVSYYGICGELAAGKASGPGSFKSIFLDQMQNINEVQIKLNINASYV